MKNNQADTNNDPPLWRKFRDGDNIAFGEIATKNYRTLYHYGMKLVHDRDFIEDCLQDLFLQLWEKRRQINDTDSIKFYLLKSFRNKILMELRKKKTIAFDEIFTDNNEDFQDESIENQIISSEKTNINQQKIKNLLETLPTRQREALYLKYFESLENEQIALMMGVNRQSVANFLHRAIEQLRQRWGAIVIFILALNIIGFKNL